MEKKQLKIWHIPQVPGKAFEVNVESLERAKLILDVLAAYDQFQYQQKIKPDFSNAQGLSKYEENYDGEGSSGWCDWCDEETDDSFAEYCRKNKIDFFGDIQKLNGIKF